MTHWWSLPRGEVILIALVAGAGLGAIGAPALGIPSVGAWVACAGLAVAFGAVAQLATRQQGNMSLPPVPLRTVVLVEIPFLAAWWLVIAPLAGVGRSDLSAASMTWFVAGLLLGRILARMLNTIAVRRVSTEGQQSSRPALRLDAASGRPGGSARAPLAGVARVTFINAD